MTSELTFLDRNKKADQLIKRQVLYTAGGKCRDYFWFEIYS